jgi:SAM-dependent methyltransferase
LPRSNDQNRAQASGIHWTQGAEPRLEIPAHLHRNSPTVAVDGYEETGSYLIAVATERLGLGTLAHSEVLDIGCGVRFAQAIVNRRIAIKSYTGIEVHRPIVDFMSENLEPFDPRFKFVHWDVGHDLFSSESSRALKDEPSLPVDSTFDVVWLFSVFTHLDLADARAMLRIIRRVIRPAGGLLFTAFIDPDLDGFEGRSRGHPLEKVYFGRRTMEGLIEETGWHLRAFHSGGARPFVQPCFVCSPRRLS